MGEAKIPAYATPEETVYIDCTLAVPRGDGHMCGVQYGRKCDGKICGKHNGKKFKCKTTGFDIELREPAP
jgi:hypothetical protein